MHETLEDRGKGTTHAADTLPLVAKKSLGQKESKPLKMLAGLSVQATSPVGEDSGKKKKKKKKAKEKKKKASVRLRFKSDGKLLRATAPLQPSPGGRVSGSCASHQSPPCAIHRGDIISSIILILALLRGGPPLLVNPG